MPRKPLPPLRPDSRLLVVKTSSLGDIIHALPVVQAISEAYPNLHLDWVVRERGADILRGHPAIRKLWVLPNKPSFKNLALLSRELHAAQYDIALDLQGLALSGLITWLSGAPFRVGWDRNRECNQFFLTHASVPGKSRNVGGQHEIDLLYGFADILGVAHRQGEFPPQPYLAVEFRDWAQTQLETLPKTCIALNVGAARAYKRWPTEYWRSLAELLIQDGYSLVFVGDSQDAQTVAQLLPSAGAFINLAGRTNLRQLASVLASCDLIVSADTGPMHIAVAVGTPVVALFGATDPKRHGPYGAHSLALYDPIPGPRPSGRPTEDYGAACLARLTPERVRDAVLKLLQSKVRP